MSSLSERDQKHLWHPYTQPKIEAPPLPISSARGAKIILDDGRELIDAVSSWWVNLHGHAHPHITHALIEQLNKFHHVIFAGFTHEPAVLLAEKLLKLLPDNQSRVFYSDDGSTAVEAAIKMALQREHNRGSKRRRVIALDGAYHGDTFGAMSVSARGAGSFSEPFERHLFEVASIPLPTDENNEPCFAAIKRELAGGEVAAFIFEPLVQGAGGMNIYSAEVLSELISICRSHGVTTIADEVFTGFGRTGRMFASDYLSNAPDIFCLSKGISGGTLPLGVTTATEEIYSSFLSDKRNTMFLHGHSYTANALACSAAIASLEILETADCRANIERITAQHQDFIKRLQKHPRITGARSLGTIFACETRGAEQGYFEPRREQLYAEFLNKGVLLRPLGGTVYTVPPYCITDEELAIVYNAIESVLSSV